MSRGTPVTFAIVFLDVLDFFLEKLVPILTTEKRHNRLQRNSQSTPHQKIPFVKTGSFFVFCFFEFFSFAAVSSKTEGGGRGMLKEEIEPHSEEEDTNGWREILVVHGFKEKERKVGVCRKQPKQGDLS